METLDLSKGRGLALLVVIAGIALGLRMQELGKPSFWGDELLALEHATGRGPAHEFLPAGVLIERGVRLTQPSAAVPWWTVCTALDTDTHPPLHFLLLRLWCGVFGRDEAGARSLSVVCSLLALIALFHAVRAWHGTEAALWAAALMALSALQIRYAQEARNYALLVALAMVAVASLIAIERAGTTWARLAVLGLGVLGMALTHYFSVGALLAIGAWAALELEGPTRRRVLATLAAAAALYLAAWGPFLWVEFVGVGQDQWHTAKACWICFAGRLLRLPAAYLGGEVAHLASWASWLGLVVWPAVAWLAVRRRALRLWAFWLLGTVGAIALVDLVRPSVQLWVLRFTLLASPALFALLAAVGAGSRSRLIRFGPPLAALVIELAFLSHARDRHPNPDWRGLAAEIDRAAGPRDVLVFGAEPRLWPGRGYELALSHYLATARPFVLLDARPPSPRLTERLRAAPGLWLLASESRLDQVPGTRVVSVFRSRHAPTLAQLAFEPAP